MKASSDEQLNEYTGDVYTSATMVVRAHSEDQARRIMAACQGIEPNLQIDSNTQVTEFNVRKVIRVVHAHSPDGEDLEVTTRPTDGEITELE